MMDTQEVTHPGCVEQDEYDNGHIPGAVRCRWETDEDISR